jgi:hypothetical protein
MRRHMSGVLGAREALAWYGPARTERAACARATGPGPGGSSAVKLRTPAAQCQRRPIAQRTEGADKNTGLRRDGTVSA